MLAAVERGFKAVGEALEATRFRDALGEAMSVARAANRYLDEQAPWKTVKTDKPAAARAVWTMLQALNGLKTLFLPFTPFAAQKLHELLGNTGEASAKGWTAQRLPTGQTLPVPTPLFVKLDITEETGAVVEK
jgi:methionyl-tRNA synthetase